jgi:hypothetical protein
MRALVLGCPGAFQVTEVPGPAPRPAKIVKVRAVTGPVTGPGRG